MSSMRDHIIKPYKVLTKDETLLRLLYYRPASPTDDPLSTSKENILDKPIETRSVIIDERIKFTPYSTDISEKQICRILVSPDDRFPNNNSYVLADQDINIDIFVHVDFNDVDLRLSWICDHINKLFNDKHISGIGKMQFKRGRRIPPPENYIAYQLIYRCSDVI